MLQKKNALIEDDFNDNTAVLFYYEEEKSHCSIFSTDEKSQEKRQAAVTGFCSHLIKINTPNTDQLGGFSNLVVHRAHRNKVLKPER